MHENGDNQRARLLARTQCQARAHRCSNGLGCVDAGHAARREHHADTWMMCVPCGVQYRAHLKGLLHLLERGFRRFSWTLQVSPRSFVPWHTDERDAHRRLRLWQLHPARELLADDRLELALRDPVCSSVGTPRLPAECRPPLASPASAAPVPPSRPVTRSAVLVLRATATFKKIWSGIAHKNVIRNVCQGDIVTLNSHG